MLCPRCGTANPDGDDFCTNCGQVLSPGAGTTRSQFDGPKWGEDAVPGWLLDLQANLPEELRDPALDQMVRERAIGSTHIGGPPEIERDEETSRPEPEITPDMEAESEEWLQSLLSSGTSEDGPLAKQEPSLSPEPDDESEAWLDALLSSREPGAPVFDTTDSQTTDVTDDSKAPETGVTVDQDLGGKPAEDREIPDWLQKGPFDEEPDEPEPIRSAASETEVLPVVPGPSSSIDEHDSTDWLQAAQRSYEQDEEATGARETELTADMPDWLRDINGLEADTTEVMSSVDDRPFEQDKGEYAEIRLPTQQQADEELPPSPQDDRQPEKPAHEEVTSEATVRDMPTVPIALESPGIQHDEEGPASRPQGFTGGPDERPGEQALDTEEKSAGEPPELVQEDSSESAGTPPVGTVPTFAATREDQPWGADEEIPEWIRQLAEQVQEEPPSPTEATQAGLPDSVESGQTVPLSHAVPGEAPADTSDIPGWLRELRDQDTLEDMEPPAWLTEAEEAVRSELPEEEIPHVKEDTPTWLAGSLPADEDGTSHEVPEWLRGLDTTEEELSREITESLEGEVPYWLRSLSEPGSAGGGAKGEADEGKQYLPEQATIAEEIPLLPREGPATDLAPTQAMDSISEPGITPVPAPGERFRVLQSGESAILRGIGPVLSAEPAIATFKPRQALLPQAIPEETEHSRILRDIANQPLMPEVTALERKSNPLWGTLGRVILYSVIIAAVVITLYWQEGLGIGFISEYNIPVSAQTHNVYEQINAVPEQSLALVVVDYEPSLAEELNAQARALLQSLMRRRFQILLMSTTLTGPQVAQNIMEELAGQPEFDYQYGEDYINLGYLPGQETSLLLFGRSPLSAVRVDFLNGRNLGDYPVTAALSEVPQKGLGEVISLVVNLSGSQDNLRTWIEQVLGANENVNMIAGVSAGLEPYARPYLDSGQLAGLLSGLIGAAEYEALSKEPGRAIRSVDTQAAVHLVIVGLIVLGNVVYALQRALGGRQESSGSWKL